MTTRSVRIPDELDARLVAFAEANHLSVNSAIVRTVEEALDRDARESTIAKAADDVFHRRRELFRRLADS
ncbi:MAG TPA: Arc family DNA-binding protein [Streptosporangiaceae bacterium]